MPISLNRRFKESPWFIGGDESIAYTCDLTVWGYDSGEEVHLKDKDGNNADTLLSGSASVVGGTLTTPKLEGLTVADSPYRLEVKWIYGGNTLEAYGEVYAEE